MRPRNLFRTPCPPRSKHPAPPVLNKVPRTGLRAVLLAGLSASLAGAVALGTVALGVTALAACGDDPPPAPSPTSPTAAQPGGGQARARAQLAARAAAAKDQRYVALYTLSTEGLPDRTVVVTRATDGGWRVDIPDGALGRTADVSVARTGQGLFQCALPSADNLIQATCVRVAGPDGELPARVDPRVQHVFVDWLAVLTDRDAAISVSTARPPDGLREPCYSVESASASLEVPLDVGIYCYGADGTLTGALLGFGTLTLAANPAPAPATVSLPGPVVSGEPLSMASPPPPPTTPPATNTPSASAG